MLQQQPESEVFQWVPYKGLLLVIVDQICFIIRLYNDNLLRDDQNMKSISSPVSDREPHWLTDKTAMCLRV